MRVFMWFLFVVFVYLFVWVFLKSFYRQYCDKSNLTKTKPDWHKHSTKIGIIHTFYACKFSEPFPLYTHTYCFGR